MKGPSFTPNQPVLLVDRDVALVERLTEKCMKKGFRVFSAYTLKDALGCLSQWPIEGLVLGSAKKADWQKCQEISPVPTLIIGSHTPYPELLSDEGLSVLRYADDYLPRPVPEFVCVARLLALIRRRTWTLETHNPQLSRDDQIEEITPWLTLYPPTHKILIFGAPLQLSPRESQILALLAETPGQPVAPSRFLQRIWQCEDSEANRTNLRTTLTYLRRRLPHGRELIQTQFPFGYRLNVGYQVPQETRHGQ